MSHSWSAVLLACGIAYGLKLAGYVVPQRLLEAPRVRRVTSLLPVALLAALVGVQTFVGSGQQTALVLDSRAVAVAVAVVALMLRAPFLLVVVLGAATAAALRLFGWG